MVEKIIAACSGAILLLGLSLYSLGGHAQNQQMARHEPHMSAAYGHLEQAHSVRGPSDARSQGGRGVRSRATEVKKHRPVRAEVRLWRSQYRRANRPGPPSLRLSFASRCKENRS